MAKAGKRLTHKGFKKETDITNIYEYGKQKTTRCNNARRYQRHRV